MCGRINFFNQKPKQEKLAQIKISRIKMQIINIILFQRPIENMVFKGDQFVSFASTDKYPIAAMKQWKIIINLLF